MRPVLVRLVAEDGTHAAHLGDRVALCGVCGRPLLKPVRSAFDVSCGTCCDQVIVLLGLTPLTDLGNGDFVVMGEWLARCVTCGLVGGVIPVTAHLREMGHAGYLVVEEDES